jgi:hypothetical protein
MSNAPLVHAIEDVNNPVYKIIKSASAEYATVHGAEMVYEPMWYWAAVCALCVDVRRS